MCLHVIKGCWTIVSGQSPSPSRPCLVSISLNLDLKRYSFGYGSFALFAKRKRELIIKLVVQLAANERLWRVVPHQSLFLSKKQASQVTAPAHLWSPNESDGCVRNEHNCTSHLQVWIGKSRDATFSHLRYPSSSALQKPTALELRDDEAQSKSLFIPSSPSGEHTDKIGRFHYLLYGFVYGSSCRTTM